MGDVEVFLLDAGVDPSFSLEGGIHDQKFGPGVPILDDPDVHTDMIKLIIGNETKSRKWRQHSNT